MLPILRCCAVLLRPLPSSRNCHRSSGRQGSLLLDLWSSLTAPPPAGCGPLRGKGPYYVPPYVILEPGALVVTLFPCDGGKTRPAKGSAGSNAAGRCYTCVRTPPRPDTPRRSSRTHTWTNTHPRVTCDMTRCMRSYSASWAGCARV